MPNETLHGTQTYWKTPCCRNVSSNCGSAAPSGPLKVDVRPLIGNVMRVIQGDLIKLAKAGEFDVIVHGCNCMGAMGAGIAKAIRAEFPAAYTADAETTKADRSKLGSITFARAQIGDRDLTVVNGYTQFDYRGSGVLVDYDALRSVFRTLKRQFSGKRIAYPLIGAGLAKGNWEVIAQIIDEELSGENHTLVRFKP